MNVARVRTTCRIVVSTTARDMLARPMPNAVIGPILAASGGVPATLCPSPDSWGCRIPSPGGCCPCLSHGPPTPACAVAQILLIAQPLITTTPVALADPPTGPLTADRGVPARSSHDGTTGGLPRSTTTTTSATPAARPGRETFSSTAAADGGHPVQYAWSGLHAWFQAVARLRPFVIPVGRHRPARTAPTSTTRVRRTAATVEPSNGFTTTGDYTFAVALGDTFGFEFSGSSG